MYRVYYIDEDPQQRERYSRLLSDSKLNIIATEPQVSLDYLSVIAADADAILIDFDLTVSKQDIKYKGATVAVQLRTLRSDLPLILLSGVLNDEGERAPFRLTRDQYDAVLDKASVSSVDATISRSLIAAIVEGYATIRETLGREPDAAKAASEILALTNDLTGSVARLAQSITVSERESRVHAAANHLLQVLACFPFPMVGRTEAAYRVGLSLENGPLLDEALATARYQGVFHDALPLNHRYWVSLLPGSETVGTLEEAQCGVCGQRAGAMCYKCEDPFDVQHTLGLELPGAPVGMGSVRICPYCLQTTLPPELAIPPRLAVVASSLVTESKQLLESRSH